MSKIEWTDNADNVFVVGGMTKNGNIKNKHGWHCEKVSPACENCYAEELNKKMFMGYGTGLAYQPKNRPLIYKVRVDLMKKWKRMRVTKYHFVNSMTDTFLDFYDDEAIKVLYEYMNDAPKQFFIILTKRPQRALELEKKGLIKWGDNIIFMVTAENQKRADELIPVLLRSEAKLKGISAEPLLGNIDLRQVKIDDKTHLDALRGWEYNSNTFVRISKDYSPLNWVIVGGESGKKARPMHPDWVRSIKDQCLEAKVPFFFKQWGNWSPYLCDLSSRKKYKQFDDGRLMVRESKKEAGAVLGGKEWREYPK